MRKRTINSKEWKKNPSKLKENGNVTSNELIKNLIKWLWTIVFGSDDDFYNKISKNDTKSIKCCMWMMKIHSWEDIEEFKKRYKRLWLHISLCEYAKLKSTDIGRANKKQAWREINHNIKKMEKNKHNKEVLSVCYNDIWIILENMITD